MRDMAVSDDRVGLTNRLVALVVSSISFVAMLIWSVPGVDPGVWNEIAVVAGLRPAQSVFPGFWRLLAGWLFPAFGYDTALRLLNFIGPAIGAVCVYSFCMIVRQILSFLIRIGRPYPVWYRFIAPFFTAVAGLCFGLSDPLWSISRTFSPEEIRLFMFLGVVQGAMRWFIAGGGWRLFPVMGLMGVMAAETSFACLLPLGFVAAYVTIWHCVMDGLFQKPEMLPDPDELPKWRMFFCFLAGLCAAVWLNAMSFTAFGGLEANGWEPTDIYVRYAAGYWHGFINAATMVGWMLGLCFCVLPFVVALRIAPLVIRDDRPMVFNLGVMMFFIGLLSILQMGAFPSGRFWTFASGTALVESGFLLAFFLFCSMVSLAIFGAAFAFECQRTYLTEDEVRPGVLLKATVPTVSVLLLLLVFWHVPKPVETEMQRIVDAGVAETVKECGDAKWLFTDGHLDAAIELESARRGGNLRTFNMMSGSEPWDIYLRRRYFEPETDDWRAAETGVPMLLRIWAGEKKGGMEGVAIQLGFEFWKRDKKPLPKASGMVAREIGMSDEEREAGIARARVLTDRILALRSVIDHASPSPALAAAFSSVNWRLSRFARLRDEVETANDLDYMNGTLRQMMDIFEQERLRTFMQLTPMEGLQIALRRADFTEAKRYAIVVLNYDEENAAANFAMGMNAIRLNRMEEAERYLRACHKVRPRDPAILNNLSIVCRRLGKYKEAVDLARQAAELLPDYPEVKETLKDALRKAP